MALFFNPASGSGGMFVQSSHFVENQGQDTTHAVTFYGQEKTKGTIPLAKMNLAVHALEGDIQEANTFYEDVHTLVGKCDFVMANPPFNVDKVDAKRVKSDVRLPFGLPSMNKQNRVSNGNYLWISYFHSYLNEKGRAGFVMSSQASSAGHGEKDVRRKLVETGDVDVMIAIRSNFFYTRTVPCELWHFDKGKPAERRDEVLMIDARHICRKVTRKIYDFSPEQLKNISAIVWLYRGEHERFLDLVKHYLDRAAAEVLKVGDALKEFQKDSLVLADETKDFVKAQSDASPVVERQTELNDAFNGLFCDGRKLFERVCQFREDWGRALPSANRDQHDAAGDLEPIVRECRDLVKQVDLVYKLMIRLLDVAEKECGARKSDDWDRRKIGRLRKDLDKCRKETVKQLKLVAYFHKQVHWLQSRFPDGVFADVEGLCKRADQKEIEENDWSLTPGRYVGVAPTEEDEDFDFETTLREIHVELTDLNREAVGLAKLIQSNFEELGV